MSCLGFDAFGDILQPQKPGTVLPQSVPGNIAPPSSGGGIIKGDLDSSLASLAQNLDINGPKGAAFKKYKRIPKLCVLNLVIILGQDNSNLEAQKI